jgi:hypothetical protein
MGEPEELPEEGRAASAARRPRQSDGGLSLQKRPNQTRASTTDPDARLARKGFGKEAKLSIVHAMIGTAERDAALVMADRIPGVGRVAVAGCKRYHTRDFISEFGA